MGNYVNIAIKNNWNQCNVMHWYSDRFSFAKWTLYLVVTDIENYKNASLPTGLFIPLGKKAVLIIRYSHLFKLRLLSSTPIVLRNIFLESKLLYLNWGLANDEKGSEGQFDF